MSKTAPTKATAIMANHPVPGGHPEHVEEPAAHEAPADAEQHVAHQPVAATLHDEPGQPAGHQPSSPISTLGDGMHARYETFV
jgi:hypothetical protein